jgi:ABC-type hemin transport system substrate-binding protein
VSRRRSRAGNHGGAVWLCACALAILGVTASMTRAAPPARIVSTSPSITESLFALGVGARVVGTSTYCRYPPEYLVWMVWRRM